ncbi:Peroxisomal membrane anchor protein (Pex14p) conserved region [Musa troglodytarum]|uniref:Peroxisomal membrane protein PEX14 n=1 Tax=Musa troglodytarum TaxID=320322 RepID=A0A9E7I0R1_9LILI|nr:Peroxisomal membrane anchor protein (Pex14p) conserved region [Musa troglodytarum]
MANQSPSPSPPSIEGSPTPGSETEKLTGGDGSDAKMDAANEFLGKPLLREDQVQNAVKFLSHPKVRSSPVVHRRSFLEKKGLTKEEIDEAFHRVPDPPSNAATGEAYTTGPAAMQQKSSTTMQHQDLVQTPQPAAAPANLVSVAPTQQLPKFHWSHALLAAGVLASSGVGTALLFKKMVVPRLKAWIRKVVEEESESGEDKLDSKLAEEAAEAAKTAAAAAAVAKAKRKYFEAFMGALDVQVKEMKSMGSVNNAWRTSQQVKFGGTSNTNFGDVRSQSSPAFMDSLYVPNPNSYTEPWQAAQHSQQRPSYSQQSHTSDERLFDERPQQRDGYHRSHQLLFCQKLQMPFGRLKPPVQKQQSGDEQSVASSDVGKEMEMRTDSVAVAENSSQLFKRSSTVL